MKTRWKRSGVILAVSTLLALFFATKFYYGGLAHGSNPTWTKQLWWQGMEWYGWALFSPLIFWGCRKLDNPEHRWRQVFGHFAIGAIFALFHCFILTTGARIEARVLHTGFSWFDLLKIVLVNHFHSNLFTYAAIVSVWHAVDYYRQLRERDRHASELEAHLAQARLRALTMQLHPHFLFNTLNGIASLNYEDPRAANRMLARLSELLRMALENGGVQEVPLRQELEFNRRYLELEQIRLGDRLQVTLEIAPETLDASVPYLLLQPLVENAIRHAIAPFSADGRVFICARREKERLLVQVKDNGPGIAGGACEANAGVGLANTQARLRELYGSKHTFELKDAVEGGLTVSISIPFCVVRARPEVLSSLVHEDSYAHR